MSAARLNRRALIGGAGIAAVAIASPAVATLSPSPARAAWDRAFASWQAASSAAEAAGWDDPFACAETDAWLVLMHMPAPHFAALHWKLDYLFGRPNRMGACDSWDFTVVAPVLADAARLAKLEG